MWWTITQTCQFTWNITSITWSLLVEAIRYKWPSYAAEHACHFKRKILDDWKVWAEMQCVKWNKMGWGPFFNKSYINLLNIIYVAVTARERSENDGAAHVKEWLMGVWIAKAFEKQTR